MISVVVLTKDQVNYLATCLESVKWADEIIIVDDDSSNELIEIAKKYTDKIFVHSLTDFASQRDFAMSQATYDWIFFIDPDERVTAGLKEEIQKIVTENESDIGAAAIPRRNFFLGKEQKAIGGWPDYVIRLVKKDRFNKWEGTLHEQPKFHGTLIHLKNPFIHLTHTDITSMTQKTLRWSYLEAGLRFDNNHPKMTSWRFFRVIITTFFDWYIKKGGYRAGTEGTIESIFQTFSVFYSYVRLWEMQRKPTLQRTYQQIDQNLINSNFTQV